MIEKKRRRDLNEGDLITPNGEFRKLFHNLNNYFISKFNQVQKGSNRLENKTKTDPKKT